MKLLGSMQGLRTQNGRLEMLLVLLGISVAGFCAFAVTYSTPHALNVGDVYELRRDGWSDSPGGQAYQGDVVPKVDTNTGTNGDNLYYQRHNVARAWPADVGYWFTASDQFSGEPDPAGEQWVDYVPPFEILGSGRYLIYGSYRWGSTRASYPAVYRVYHALGTNEVLRDQRLGTVGQTIEYFLIGGFEMRPGSFVRVEDTGSESITFAHMRFTYVSPVPQLQIAVTNGLCQLSWPTNASAYRLEWTTNLTSSTNWQPILESPGTTGSLLSVSLPLVDDRRFFRLVQP